MPDGLSARFHAGEALGAIWLSLGTPAAADLAAEAGPDALVFDTRHGAWDPAVLRATIARLATPSLVCTRADDMTAALAAGAAGVIVAGADAPEPAIAAARRAAPDAVIGLMIDTAGLPQAAAHAATPGLDLLFFDTGDTPVEPVPGIPCGIRTAYATQASERRRAGFALTVLADDSILLGAALRTAAARFGPHAPPHFPWAATTAFVTGTSRGIGPALVRRFLAAGCPRIYCAARDPASLADLIEADPDRLRPITLDVTDPEAVAAAAAAAPDTTLLINNAGVNFNRAFTAPNVLDRARVELDVNYLGPLRLTRAFAPILARNGGGAIVNILSILAEVSLPAMGPLCASKAAALSFTQAARAHLRPRGTRVLAILPGAVDTDMSRDMQAPKMPPEAVADAVIDGLERGLEDVYPGDMAAGIAFGRVLDPKAVERDFANYLDPAETW